MDDFVEKFMNATPAPADAVTIRDKPLDKALLEQQVIHALRQVFDPEILVNIYDLGLIYAINIDDDNAVSVDMTLTAPGCPVAQTFPGTVECAVGCVDGVTSAHVELVWDPPWSMERMSEEVRLQLGLL